MFIQSARSDIGKTYLAPLMTDALNGKLEVIASVQSRSNLNSLRKFR